MHYIIAFLVWAVIVVGGILAWWLILPALGLSGGAAFLLSYGVGFILSLIGMAAAYGTLEALDQA